MHAGVEGEGKVLVHKDGLEEGAKEEGQGPHESDIVRSVWIVQPLDDVGGCERADKAQDILDELGNGRQVEAPAKGPAPMARPQDMRFRQKGVGWICGGWAGGQANALAKGAHERWLGQAKLLLPVSFKLSRDPAVARRLR